MLSDVISPGARRVYDDRRALTERDAFDAAMQAGAPANGMQPLDDRGSQPAAVVVSPLRDDVLNSVRISPAGNGALIEPKPAPALTPRAALDASLDPSMRAATDRGFQALAEPVAAPSPSMQPLGDRRAALGAAAGDVMPGPMQQRAVAILREPTDVHQGQHVGFGERLLHGLKESGKLLVATRNPLDAAAGLVAGVADPDSYHRVSRGLQIPGALNEALAENQLQAGNLARAHSYAALTERDPYSGGYTMPGAAKAAQIANYGSEMDARDRQRTREEQALGVTRYEKWAQTAAPGTKIPDGLADDAGIPRGSTVWHNTRTGEHYYRAPNGQRMQTRDGVASPVLDERGNPVFEWTPPVREPQTPQYVTEGQALEELYREHNITDPNALVDNPVFADRFNQAKAAEAESSKRYGYPMPSDAEIAASVAKHTPAKIRAGQLVTPEMVKQRAAQIYQRPRAKSSSPSSSAKPSASPSARQQQMGAHEQQYQQLYPRLSPEDRRKLEDAFKAEYGRAPRPPAGVN